MHRAAVSIDQFPNINALGLFVADIVPIVEEYASFSNPNYSTGYFHWVSNLLWLDVKGIDVRDAEFPTQR